MTMSYEAVIRQARRRPLFTPGPGSRTLDLGVEALKTLLPHREPFLFLSSVRGLDPEAQATWGERRVDPDDPVLRGHFPGDPVYPGVLLIETMAQLCICLQGLLGREHTGEAGPAPSVRLLKVHEAIFVNEVKPGDTLEVLARLLEDNGTTAIMAAQVCKGGTPCAAAVLEAIRIDA